MLLAKRLVVIFIVALILNFFWEYWHAQFYVHYQGQPITKALLNYTAVFDAYFSTLVAIPLLLIAKIRDKVWLGVLVATLYAIGLEMYALETGRWAYKITMPLIPILNVGLTPTIQLGLLFYISYKVAQRL